MSEEKQKKCHKETCDKHHHKHNDECCHSHEHGDFDQEEHCGDECDCGGHCHGDECCCGDAQCDEPRVTEINLDYLDIAQRLKAEFDNYKRRNENLKKDSYLEGMGDAILKLLPVLDGFDQALKTIDDEQIRMGVEMIKKQMISILEGMGVEKIECVGKEFDPHLHNAVYAESVDGKEKDLVLEEFQAGYNFNGKVLRHSVVKISK